MIGHLGSHCPSCACLRLDCEFDRLARADAMDKPRIEDSKVQRRRRTEKDGCFRKLDRKRVFASNGKLLGMAQSTAPSLGVVM